jgi:hypothetical protein
MVIAAEWAQNVSVPFHFGSGQPQTASRLLEFDPARDITGRRDSGGTMQIKSFRPSRKPRLAPALTSLASMQANGRAS